jgi:hypothetical protein
VGDRTVGNPDAGATAVVIALQAVVEPDEVERASS